MQCVGLRAQLEGTDRRAGPAGADPRLPKPLGSANAGLLLSHSRYAALTPPPPANSPELAGHFLHPIDCLV